MRRWSSTPWCLIEMSLIQVRQREGGRKGGREGGRRRRRKGGEGRGGERKSIVDGLVSDITNQAL